MFNVGNKTQTQLIFAIIASAMIFLNQIVEIKSDFASDQELNQEMIEESVSSDDLGELQLKLRPLTAWEFVKVSTMVYINPESLNEKSFVYLYEFTSEQFSKSVKEIMKSIDGNRKSSWYVGPVKDENSEDSSIEWTPQKLEDIDLDSFLDTEKQAYASSSPIPNREESGAYRKPTVELIKLSGQF